MKVISSHSTAHDFCLDTGQRGTDRPMVSLKIGDTRHYPSPGRCSILAHTDACNRFPNPPS